MKHKIWQNLCTFKNSYFSKFDCKKKMTYWGTVNTIYKIFQNISFENSSWRKHVFWEKDPRKDNSHQCKVNTLACYMSFGPQKYIVQTTLGCRLSKLSTTISLPHALKLSIVSFGSTNMNITMCPKVIKYYTLRLWILDFFHGAYVPSIHAMHKEKLK
jgi:hypothetical protein